MNLDGFNEETRPVMPPLRLIEIKLANSGSEGVEGHRITIEHGTLAISRWFMHPQGYLEQVVKAYAPGVWIEATDVTKNYDPAGGVKFS